MTTLNESDAYFAHLFSVSKKHNHRNDPSNKRGRKYNPCGEGDDAEAEMFLHRKHNYVALKKQEEDVDAEADDFIDHEHQKFKLSKWMSTSIG